MIDDSYEVYKLKRDDYIAEYKTNDSDIKLYNKEYDILTIDEDDLNSVISLLLEIRTKISQEPK